MAEDSVPEEAYCLDVIALTLETYWWLTGTLRQDGPVHKTIRKHRSYMNLLRNPLREVYGDGT